MKKLIIPTLLFLWLGCADALAQSCLSDSLFTGSASDTQTSQAVFMQSAKWLPGQKLRVKFLDGDPAVIAKVEADAELWETFANINFVFVTTGEAEIRVSFKYAGSWSLVGKRSLTYSSDGSHGFSNNTGASMNFGWFDRSTSDDEIRRTTLHEFGHALGLLHEHQNANATFHWNEPVVMNHFVNELGWTREQVQEQVLNRYGPGTEYSNRAYDPMSIMHYAIPANFTLEGKAIGYNNVLSTGDKAIIREMYPRDTATASGNSDVTFNNIDVDYNVTQGDQRGMNIKVDFTIKNALKQEHRLVAFFYDANGKPLKDSNGKFNTSGGTVAVNQFFTPNYAAARYATYTLFMPYAELEVPCGDYKLRFNVDVQKNGAEIAQSGAQYFSFGRCPAVVQVNATVKPDVTIDGKTGLNIFPAFSVNRAQGQSLRVTAYLYRADGTGLTGASKAFSASNGQVAVWQDIKPAYDVTAYNQGATPNLSLFIPYDELHLSAAERNNLKLFVSVTQGDATVRKSTWIPFAVDQRGRFKLTFENTCDEKASVLVYFTNLDGQWEAKGWYTVLPGKSIYIEDTRNRIFYYYATSDSHVWKGDKTYAFKGTNYAFREKTIAEKDWGATKTVLSCE